MRMIWILTCKTFLLFIILFLKFLLTSQENGDLEDLWDFGTVRHGGRPNTIGRSQNSIRVSGPPLTWENNGASVHHYEEQPVSPSRRTSGTFYSSVTTKGELPPLPPNASTPRFEQSTVRHMPPGAEQPKSSPPLTAEQQHPDGYEDYDDQYVDTFSSAKTNMLHQKMQDIQLEDDLPDTTMLDSVVLPAIASVSFIPNSLILSCSYVLCSYSPGFLRKKPE